MVSSEGEVRNERDKGEEFERPSGLSLEAAGDSNDSRVSLSEPTTVMTTEHLGDISAVGGFESALELEEGRREAECQTETDDFARLTELERIGESAVPFDGIVEVIEVEAPKVDLDPESPFFDRYEYFRPRRKRIFGIQIMVSLLTQISNTIYFPLIVTIESTLRLPFLLSLTECIR